MQHGTHGAVRATPVGHSEALEAPLAAENLVEEVLILGAVIAVYLVVCGHHAHGAAFNNGTLEGLEIDLTEGTLAQDGVHATAVGLLVVNGEVLDTYGCTFVLHTLGVFQGQGGGEDGILGEVLVGTATHRQALDVHSRAEDDVLTTEAGFLTHAGTVLVSEFFTPGSGESAAGREVGGAVQGPACAHEAVGLSFFTDAEGTVGVVHVCNAKALHAGRRHVGLAVQHVHLFFQGHLGNDLVDFLVVDGELVLGGLGTAASYRQNGGRGQD